MTTVADLDPRRDMDLIRARVLHAFEAREDIVPLLTVLAERNPVALADLLVGAKAPEHAAWVEAALRVVDALEQSLAPTGLYGRLASLHPDTATDVLAIAARRLGMGPVLAIDMDDDSVRATTRAARANMVDGVIARRAVIGRDPVAPAPILLANITLEVLRVLAAALAGHADATVTRHAVLSGLRPYEVDDAVRAFAPLGLAARARREEDGWASVRLSV